MLVVTRFDVQDQSDFLERAERALAAFSARPGFVRGRIGRAADDPSQWVLTTEWVGVGAYRRSLSAYDVKVDATPLLAGGRDEPSAFELLLSVEGSSEALPGRSVRAADAGEVGLGSAAGPHPPSSDPGRR